MKSRTLGEGIAIVLVIALLMAMMNVTVVYGGEVVEEEKGNYQRMMDSLGLDTDIITPSTSSEENFSIHFDNNVTDIVNKTVLENGDVKINIAEGDLINELLIKSDGSVYIDGSLVTVSKDGGEFTPLKLNYEYYASMIQPRLNDYNFTTTCPYGSASDYTDSRTYKEVVSLGMKVFSSVTQTAWVSIITGLIGVLSAPAGVISPLFIAGALEHLKSKTPSSNASSIKTVKSFHKTKGYTVKNGMSVAKYDVTYYTNKDYTGVIKNSAGKSVFSGYDVFTW